MKVIELTKGRVTVVDDEDFAELAQYRWGFLNGYARRTIRLGVNSRKHVYLHRVLMKCESASREIQVDHINGDKLDNRRCNLRMATNSQNVCNCGVRRGTLTGFKGVSLHKTGKFMGRIMKDGRNHYLGLFETREDASGAYAKAALELHGEFARLN